MPPSSDFVVCAKPFLHCIIKCDWCRHECSTLKWKFQHFPTLRTTANRVFYTTKVNCLVSWLKWIAHWPLWNNSPAHIDRNSLATSTNVLVCFIDNVLILKIYAIPLFIHWLLLIILTAPNELHMRLAIFFRPLRNHTCLEYIYLFLHDFTALIVIQFMFGEFCTSILPTQIM